MVAEGVIYVLQGIAHMGTNEGQLAKIWREHDHFTSRVIARYPSEPVDWIRRGDGSWRIATWSAIWQTREGAPSTILARLPDIMSYPTSLVSTADGTLFVGTRGGVVRLSPTWPDVPRYATDFLWMPAARGRDCHTLRARQNSALTAGAMPSTAARPTSAQRLASKRQARTRLYPPSPRRIRAERDCGQASSRPGHP